MNRILFIFLTLLTVVRAECAMVRVAGIENGRTITIDREGTRVSVRLAGIAITDELRARELLQWTIGKSWVMLEAAGEEFLVYRSPDALFLNRELVLRGYARATMPGIEPETQLAVTYLGIVNPAARSTAVPAPKTDSGTTRRSRATPSPRASGRSNAATAPTGRAPRARSSGSRTGGPPPPRSAD